MSTHSKIGPSGAKTWTKCTASVSFIEANAHRLPADVGSVYAAEGTEAHSWAEKVLRGELEISEVPEDFRVHVWRYVETCLGLVADAPDAQVYVERKVPLFYRPTDIGTVDWMVVSEKGVHVRDLKYGAGVLVESDHNLQLAIYAWSAITDLEDAGLYEFHPAMPVTIQVIQPRHHEWVDQPWTLTVGELREFCEIEISPAAWNILNDGPTRFAPSEESCRWCKAKMICAIRAKFFENIPSMINPLEHFENLDGPLPEALSDEQLLSAFRHAKAVIQWLGEIDEHLLEMAISGKPLAGTKLVQGRQGNRAWKVEDNLVALELERLGLTKFDDRFTTAVISVANAEKKLKALGVDPSPLDELVSRSEGKPTIALEADKRPRIASSISMLENLDE